MFFSIVFCVNRENPFLEEAIESILNQEFEGFEFILIANNCSDEFYNYLASNYSKKLRLFRTVIGQLSFNLNYGIDKSFGDYIVRMDADDISKPGRLKILHHNIIINDFPDLMGSCGDFIDEHNNITSSFIQPLSNESIRKQLYYKNPFIHPSVAIKKQILIDNGGYLGGFASEDYELWLRLARNSDIKMLNIPDSLISYRINETQSRGRLLPYSEVAGHLLKEFLYTKKIKYFIGTLIAITKAIVYAKK